MGKDERTINNDRKQKKSHFKLTFWVGGAKIKSKEGVLIINIVIGRKQMVRIQYWGDRSGNETGHTENFEKIVEILGLSQAQRDSLMSLQKLKMDATAIPTINPKTGDILITLTAAGSLLWGGKLKEKCDWKKILIQVRAEKIKKLRVLISKANIAGHIIETLDKL